MSSIPRLNQDNAASRFLERNLEAGRGENVCLRWDEETMTYSQLLQAASRAGNRFEEYGVEYENRVLLILPDCPEQVACVLGLMRIGAVPVPVSTQLSVNDYLYLCADCRPKGVVITPEHLPILEQVRKQLPFPKFVWVLADDEVPPGYTSFDRLMHGAPDECPIHPTSTDDIAVIQYTSGSTGMPKGVVHLHRGLIAVLAGIPQRLQLTERDICFSAAKLFFGYGFGNSLLFPLSVGASSVLFSDMADALSVCNIVQSYRPTIFFGVPSLYAAVLRLLGEDREFDFSSLRLCVSAGERLPTMLLHRWREACGLEIVDALGTTECLHAFVTTEPGHSPEGSTGTPVPDYELKILDDQGQPISSGEVGHLYVKGSANGARYWNNHPETIATMIGPWTRTGDLLYQDTDGFYFYVGRSDDVLKVGGLKVAPTEIEECLLQHESVSECTVVGILDKNDMTAVVAYVCVNAGWEEDTRTKRLLRAHLRRFLSAHKLPRAIEFVPELPRTTTGKLARYKLREKAAAPSGLRRRLT